MCTDMSAPQLLKLRVRPSNTQTAALRVGKIPSGAVGDAGGSEELKSRKNRLKANSLCKVGERKS